MIKDIFVRFLKLLILSVTLVAYVGCAARQPYTQTKDPLEKLNRKIFSFNRMVDIVIIKPTAQVYEWVLPNPVQKGVSNAFANLAEIPTVINDVLQLKIGHAIADTWRFAFNSTIGIGGLCDVASSFGLKPHYTDLGLTFARWGITNTPYFVIPILGPSTITDAVGLGVNYSFFTVYPYLRPKTLTYGLVGLDLVRIRAELLPTDKLIDQALDPYVFVRDAYFQHRAYLANEQTEEQEDDFGVEGSAIMPM